MMNDFLKPFWLVDNARQGIILAEGCELPNGQVALAWRNGKSHGLYPSLDSFRKIQDAQPERLIIPFDIRPPDEYTRPFKLIRDEDVTGISGTGVVAVGCSFDTIPIVVMQWLTETNSTFWYQNMEFVEEIHGHSGQTRVVFNHCPGLPRR